MKNKDYDSDGDNDMAGGRNPDRASDRPAHAPTVQPPRHHPQAHTPMKPAPKRPC